MTLGTDILGRIEAFEKDVLKYETTTGEKLTENIKCAVLQKGMNAAFGTKASECIWS